MADRFGENVRYVLAGERLNRLSLMGRFVMLVTALITVLYAIGFLIFVNSLHQDEIEPLAPADAIVVLTGGADRIADAMQLLAEGRGKRLLISGVNTVSTPKSVARTLPDFADLFGCCVDFDYGANDTVGNAVETRRWARDHNVQSMLVVTSNYHMPRALIEFRRAMPQSRFTARPVVPYGFDAARWWRDPATARILVSEYSKYLAASAREVFSPVIEEDPSSRGIVKRGLQPG